MHILILLKIDLKRFNKNIKNAYKDFLLTNDTIEKIAILEDLKQRYRSYVPAYYLLGRIYLRQGFFNRAIEHLEFSEIRRLPGDNLRMENLRSLGVAQYSAGDYYGAIKTFKKLARMDEKGGEFKSYAENFIDRANCGPLTYQNEDMHIRNLFCPKVHLPLKYLLYLYQFW